MTFNILKYTDPGLTLFFPVLILLLGGIALPGAAVYIDHSKLRNRYWESAVSAVGPLSNLFVAFILALPFILHVDPASFPAGSAAWIFPGLAFLIELQLSAVLLNSLPIPPFDGYGVVEPWLPGSMRKKLRNYSGYAMWIVFLLLWSVPELNRAFWSVIVTAAAALSVPDVLALVGYKEFQKNSLFLVLPLLLTLFLMRPRQQKTAPTALDYYEAGRQLLADKQFDKALYAFDQAVSMKPELAQAWHLRGLAFALLHENGQALLNFEQALKLAPDYADCWYNRSCCLSLQGQADEALASLQKAISFNGSEFKSRARQDVGFQSLWQDPRFRALTSAE